MNRAPTAEPIDVACLVLIDSRGRVFAARRPPCKSLAGLWELPGGKIDPGESPEHALRRELREELAMEVGPLTALPCHEHPYEFATIRLWPMLARCHSQSHPPFHLHEHTAAQWIAPEHAGQLDWAPADIPVLADAFTRV
jgi:8-oxo-dGTP diphosphatase